mgnify:CR=1 FL=1
MRTPLLVLIAASAFAALAGIPSDHEKGVRRPNVLLIVIDTLRADALGRGITPNLDALAKEGVRFEEAFTHAPMTLPAHTSLFTSRLPSQTHVLTNGQAVGQTIPLLGQHLADRGYDALAAVSLATLWPVIAGCGVDRGFHIYDTGHRPVERGHEVLPRITRLLEGRDTAEPFFLFAHFSDPHGPYNCHGTAAHNANVFIDGEPAGAATTSEMSWWRRTLALEAGVHTIRFSSTQPFMARDIRVSSDGDLITPRFTEGAPLRAHTNLTFQFDSTGSPVEVCVWLNDAPDLEEIRRRYDLEVAAVDRAIGALLADLERRGLADETLVVLTSDHGEALGEHGQIGHVNTLYDEVLHVPLIIRSPRRHDRRALERNASRLVTHIDLAPTVLEFLDIAPWDGMHGTSLLSDTRARTLLAETHKPEAPRDLFCLRDERTKLIYDPSAQRFTCYDLVADPAEERDVYAARADSLASWQARLRAQAAKTSKRPATRRDARGHLAALGYAGG